MQLRLDRERGRRSVGSPWSGMSEIMMFAGFGAKPMSSGPAQTRV
jgi:hypothetical protein